MIHITDLSLLKITKVKPWVIYFDYDGRHYFVKGKSELGEGSWQELYERKPSGNGKYSFIKLRCCNYTTDSVASDYIKKQAGKTIVYSHINKVYFVYVLTKHGFATGMMESFVEEIANGMSEVEKRIKEYEKEISLLRKQKREIADNVLAIVIMEESVKAVRKALVHEMAKNIAGWGKNES